jgi:hypothetical protein
MRELNHTDLAAVSGGHFFSCSKPVVVKPACGCAVSPLSFVLGFVGGALKLLCTGEPSTPAPSTCPGTDTDTGTGTGVPILR